MLSLTDTVLKTELQKHGDHTVGVPDMVVKVMLPFIFGFVNDCKNVHGDGNCGFRLWLWH